MKIAQVGRAKVERTTAQTLTGALSISKIKTNRIEAKLTDGDYSEIVTFWYSVLLVSCCENTGYFLMWRRYIDVFSVFNDSNLT